MKYLKRLEKLEEMVSKMPDPRYEELALWMEQNPPQPISVNPNSHDEWLKTIPPHLHESFARWSENILAYVHYFSKHDRYHAYSCESIQETPLDSSNASKVDVIPEAGSNFLSHYESSDCGVFRI